MKTLSLLIVVSFLGGGVIAQTPSDSSFLKTLQDGETYAAIFKAQMSFEAHKPAGDTGNAVLTIYENNGKSIAQFQSPSRDRGKTVLQIDSKYWMYFPKAKRSTVLSPMAQMVGNASNGDVLRPPDSTLYAITILGSEPRVGNRSVQFVALTRKAPYGKIISHYQDFQVLESEMYSRSGILLKKAYYEEHKRSENGSTWIPVKTRIVDGQNEDVYTIIVFSELQQLERINENWFNPNNLGRVR